MALNNDQLIRAAAVRAAADAAVIDPWHRPAIEASQWLIILAKQLEKYIRSGA